MQNRGSTATAVVGVVVVVVVVGVVVVSIAVLVVVGAFAKRWEEVSKKEQQQMHWQTQESQL